MLFFFSFHLSFVSITFFVLFSSSHTGKRVFTSHNCVTISIKGAATLNLIFLLKQFLSFAISFVAANHFQSKGGTECFAPSGGVMI